MFFVLKYSLTRWLSVEKKSALVGENLIALDDFMRYRFCLLEAETEKVTTIEFKCSQITPYNEC